MFFLYFVYFKLIVRMIVKEVILILVVVLDIKVIRNGVCFRFEKEKYLLIL